MDSHDLRTLDMAGPEPSFDPVMRDFLANCAEELRQRQERGGLLEYASLGRDLPWLYRLTFRTRGLARTTGGDIVTAEEHVVALRFLPDYLRRADRFEMLALLEPGNAFHPNLRPPGICVEVRPGESLVEICESLHALFSWRLRQLAENDALNRDACAWGRAHFDALPTDTRPLFGRALRITLEPAEARS
jgi:hypothetical protein